MPDRHIHGPWMEPNVTPSNVTPGMVSFFSPTTTLDHPLRQSPQDHHMSMDVDSRVPVTSPGNRITHPRGFRSLPIPGTMDVFLAQERRNQPTSDQPGTNKPVFSARLGFFPNSKRTDCCRFLRKCKNTVPLVSSSFRRSSPGGVAGEVHDGRPRLGDSVLDPMPRGTSKRTRKGPVLGRTRTRRWCEGVGR